MTQTLNRRQFLRSTGILGLGIAVGGLAAPYVARGAATRIRIVSNPGLENATLNLLMEQQRYFRMFGVDAEIMQTPGVSGPFDAIASGAADVCMVSGYNMVLSRIERGASVKIVGAGMRKPALAVFARPDSFRTLADLQGKTVAVGPPMGTLHTLMLQLLYEKELDASRINFVDKGSNEQCYEAVVRGEADACCASISHLNDPDGLAVVSDGNLWQSLPKCVFQTAYASEFALRDKQEGMAGVMAAYGALYGYLMSPDAHDAFFAARRQAQKTFDRASAQAIWDFNQLQQPYSRDLSLTSADIGYLQDMFIRQGSLRRKQPFAEVADMSAAHAAAKLLR